MDLLEDLDMFKLVDADYFVALICIRCDRDAVDLDHGDSLGTIARLARQHAETCTELGKL